MKVYIDGIRTWEVIYMDPPKSVLNDYSVLVSSDLEVAPQFVLNYVEPPPPSPE